MLQLSVPHDQQPFDKVFKVTLELTKAANNITTKYVNFMIRKIRNNLMKLKFVNFIH